MDGTRFAYCLTEEHSLSSAYFPQRTNVPVAMFTHIAKPASVFAIQVFMEQVSVANATERGVSILRSANN